MIGSKNMELNQAVGQGGTTKAVSMFRLDKSQIMFQLLCIFYSQLFDIPIQ